MPYNDMLTPRNLTEKRLSPVDYHPLEQGTVFFDFGKAAFGTLLVPCPVDGRRSIVVHLGEKLDSSGRIDRNPPGCIRYKRIEQLLDSGSPEIKIRIPADERNTRPRAVLMPEQIGEVFPFRYAEVEGFQDQNVEGVARTFVHYPFDDSNSDFTSSDPVLNQVWDLCKYSIKATSFCGVYIDGDRERIAYEGDAYINQLGHYCTDREYRMARVTNAYMIDHPTWPSDWQLHIPMMFWTDYLYTGDTAPLEKFYDDLIHKTLIELAREDGLISSESENCTADFMRKLHFNPETTERIRDLVDWPPGSFTDGNTGEQDNHDMRPVNTVTNAFHANALRLLSGIAGALGKRPDRERFSRQAERVTETINQKLFNRETGLYVDGEGSSHSSLHSNMFMLAFGLVPEARKPKVINFIKSRGMACSVYGAQHLLEALYLNGEDTHALELMTATHDRSWMNMLTSGSTITMEAWDLKYKNNLDWNHAWGAAPANIIPRYILGVRPLEPGFSKVLIQPQPGSLTSASGVVPTPRGNIRVSFEVAEDGTMDVQTEVPEGVEARLSKS